MDLGEVGQCSDGIFLETRNFGKLRGEGLLATQIGALQV